MAAVRGTIQVDIDTCKGCELCIEACPQESLELSGNLNNQGYHYAVLIRDNCTGCENCAMVCPDAVITVYRTPKKGARADARREPLATVSNVRANIRISVDEIPEGKVDL
jgi:2-oxoglutarate ferredoxin oxidoreductase subunit delta